MRLYVCYGFLKDWAHPSPRPGGHPCGVALKALQKAGYEPDVEGVGGVGFVPGLNQTAGRKKMRELTGSPMVPVLELDGGEVIFDSKKITEWAAANPAQASSAA